MKAVNATSTYKRMSDGQHNLASKLRPLCELVNHSGEWQSFLKRWPELFIPFDADVMKRAKAYHNAIESLASPPSLPQDEKVEIGFIRGAIDRTGKPIPDEMLVGGVVLSFDELSQYLQEAWRGKESVLRTLFTWIVVCEPTWDAPIVFPSTRAVTVNWRKGDLDYCPATPLQELCYLLLRNSQLAKVCGNPECPAPYFIAERAIQRYCTAKCAGVFQRQSKLSWWKRKGSKRRAAKKSKRAKR